jgi:hypothetical protein
MHLFLPLCPRDKMTVSGERGLGAKDGDPHELR